MKKLIFSLAMASAVLMTTVTTSCKKDNAKPVNNSTTVDPAELAAAQKEYDDAKAELEVANRLVVVPGVAEVVDKPAVYFSTSEIKSPATSGTPDVYFSTSEIKSPATSGTPDVYFSTSEIKSGSIQNGNAVYYTENEAI